MNIRKCGHLQKVIPFCSRKLALLCTSQPAGSTLSMQSHQLAVIRLQHRHVDDVVDRLKCHQSISEAMCTFLT